MRRLAICLVIALTLGCAGMVHAQTFESERQNPKEFQNDDTQPLKIASYFIAPIGFALEWTVARPLHYLATQTFMAPAMSPDLAGRYTLPKITALPPPDKFAPEPSEQAAASPSALGKTRPGAPSASPGGSAVSPSQPAMH